MPRPGHGQAGFSLLEVLVAIVVLSLGILGVAGLINVSLKNGHSALLRAQAAQYTADMLDRMRANRVVATGGGYNLAMTAAAPTGTSLADYDRADWLAQLATLPAGDGEIAVDGNGVASVTVQWDETAFGGGLAKYEVRSQL